MDEPRSDLSRINLGPSEVRRVAYHENLNVILAGTKDRRIHVIDPTLREVIYSTPVISDGDPDTPWDFDVESDKVIVVDKNLVGIRSEYNGILLLGSILKTRVKSSKEKVQIELSKSEGEILVQALSTLDIANDLEASAIVLKQLKLLLTNAKETEAESIEKSPLLGAKKEKWNTITLELPSNVLKNCVQQLVTDLVKKTRYIPQLSVASSILERLNMLLPQPAGDVDLPLDKTQMFSELGRLNTFSNWPHTDYKWALPDKMAQAGFYHNPSQNGDDRALCFSCNLCLVSWEPTDEPWSEHERHSPYCPFVRGDHTHNVPLSLSFATSPATKIGKPGQDFGSSILGESSLPSAAVVGYSSGHVEIWEIYKQVKEAAKFNVLLKDIVKSGKSSTSYCDVALMPKEAWVMDPSEILGEDLAHIAQESLQNTINNVEESVTLSSVCLLGPPPGEGGNAAIFHPPPSVVVAGQIVRENIKEKSTLKVPFVGVYSLSPNAIKTACGGDPVATNKVNDYNNLGSTGTKQENQVYEEEAFTSYISEADMMTSDMSIFSDLDSSAGAFLEIPVMTMSSAMPGPMPMPAFVQNQNSKKKNGTATSTPSKTIMKNDDSNKSKGSRKFGDATIFLQHVDLPIGEEFKNCTKISRVFPTPDGKKLIVILEAEVECKEGSVFGAVLSYPITADTLFVRVGKEPTAIRKICRAQDIPTATTFISADGEGSTEQEPVLAASLRSGDLALFKTTDFTCFSIITRNKTDKVASLTYVSSLERLCCAVSSGGLEFYSVTNPTDTDVEVLKAKEAVKETLPDSVSSSSATIDSSASRTKSSSSSTEGQSHRSIVVSPDDSSLRVNAAYTLGNLMDLLSLTHFQNIKPSFSANVSGCWQKVIQAQKDRKHPQHLQYNENEINGTTLTWKLQRNKVSKREHLFEITLPKTMRVGHLDLKFVLHPGCSPNNPPQIEVSLYRAIQPNQPSEPAGNGAREIAQGKSIANEFLKSIDGELVCGPLELSRYIDLSSQGGTMIMTSPSLLLKKGRNFYLHVKAKDWATLDDKESEDENEKTTEEGLKSANNVAGSTGVSKQPKILAKKKPDWLASEGKIMQAAAAMGIWGTKEEFLNSSFDLQAAPFFTAATQMGPPHTHKCPVGGPLSYAAGITLPPPPPKDETEVRKEFKGCDWLNEVSISIRQVKTTNIPHEDFERKAMLTLPSVWASLLRVAVLECQGEENITFEQQSLALDLLVWIAAVHLSSPSVSGSPGAPLRLMRDVEEKLEALIMQGILYADRSTAHKTAKLLVLCVEASETFYSVNDVNFSMSLLEDLLSLLPHIVSCASAGSLQWFFLLLNRVRGENLGKASDALLYILKDVSEELKQRTDPLHSLLRTRFGLYGTPFEPELFEIEIPPVTKSYSAPLSYAGIYGAETFQPFTTGSGTFHLWGLKDVDFRDLLIGNPSTSSGRLSKVGTLAPKQQIQGLLEVEPLHFTCHASSEGTRLERIDLGIAGGSCSYAPPFPLGEDFGTSVATNMQTGEGSKKAEGDKSQMMMLQKALKMDSAEMMDYLEDLKFMGGSNYKMMELPYASTGASDLIAALSQAGHVMVVKPSVTASAVASAGVGAGPIYQGISFSMPSMTQPTTTAPQPAPLSKPMKLKKLMKGDNDGPEVEPAAEKILDRRIRGPGIIEYLVSWKGLGPEDNTWVASENLSPYLISGFEHALTGTSKDANKQEEGLRLHLTPWQQMMYVPPQQAIVIERMHSGARRYVVLDFGGPVLLTDMIIPSCPDLVSLAIDIWVQREDTDGTRLVVATDIGIRTLVISDLQPPPVCRYLKITVIGRYGMGTTKCRIPLGLFYGHTTVLPSDLSPATNSANQFATLSPVNVQAHLSILSYLVEDIGCRYQLACSKLRGLLEPLLKPEISVIHHISYYLPKGKERNKLGLNQPSDQTILAAYQECITLQQQLNVSKNVVRRLQRSLAPFLPNSSTALLGLQEIPTDKVHLLSEFLIETLLGISFLAANAPLTQNMMPFSLYSHMNQEVCESLFRNICVLENGQCQLSACTLMLRVCGFQSWWGQFLAKMVKQLFSAETNFLFPQDRVFILLVYLGQKSLLTWRNAAVLESALQLLLEILAPLGNTKMYFLSSGLDMTLLGWSLMYLSLILDGLSCSLTSPSDQNTQKSNKDKDASCISSRWDFIQGESALYRKVTGIPKQPEQGGYRRRITKKILHNTKAKLEELDSVAAAVSTVQPVVGLGMQLSALTNKAEALKKTQAAWGKNIKLQSSKHFKDLLQLRRTEMLMKRRGVTQMTEREDSRTSDIEINIDLDPTLCLSVGKRLGELILRMDSTSHSDIFLLLCKSLAKISTTARPALSLASIFNQEGLLSLILPAVSSDFIKQKNWSSPWVSHAVMCLMQDLLEGEKLYPLKRDEDINIMAASAASNPPEETVTPTNTPLTSARESQGMTDDSEILIPGDQDMSMSSTDEVDAEADAQAVCDFVSQIKSAICTNSGEGEVPMDICSLTSEDSDTEEIPSGPSPPLMPQVLQPLPSLVDEPSGASAPKKINEKGFSTGKKWAPCVTSVSAALDARLENGVESTTEIRLRMMAVVDSEVLSQSLRAPIDVPREVLKFTQSESNYNSPRGKKETSSSPPDSIAPSSVELLSGAFERVTGMMASDNASISIQRVLQLWVSINMELAGSCDTQEIKPVVPLSTKAVSSLMNAFTKNSGIGVQEWGLVFQTLTLVSNQRTLDSPNGMWLYIISDKAFPDLILRFISGSGMHLQKNNVVSAGPTVCQHFYNFLLRLRHLSADTAWTGCLKEILLRVLSLFLAGPFSTTDFPIDAFNKFLDRLTCPDLSYVNPATVVSIIQQFAQILHQYIFFPKKLNIKAGGEIKSLHAAPSPANSGNGDTKPAKAQTFDHVMFRLMSFTASFLTLPYKTAASSDKGVDELLSSLDRSWQLDEHERELEQHVAKCGKDGPRTIADLLLQMETTMMRLLSVLAAPNGINVLAAGDLATAFNILDTSPPLTLVDAVIHLFSKLQQAASKPTWLIEPVLKFLASTPYSDFCCPFIVSETFVLMVLKLISEKEENLENFAAMSCVEAICQKFVISARRFFSSTPTFVSVLTQYIGRTDSNALFGPGSKKLGGAGAAGDGIELEEGVINVAPLGTITSSNFSAHPSDVLLQATPPHRRARTPVWSYHFFPEETYLELVITLPCAVLLKELHVIPHVTSLSTCPSAIMVEISRDQSNTTLPMGPPVNCSGMSHIVIQLTEPEVAKTVLLRLFKPKDSSNLGLSQIRLLGSTTFSEAALQGLSVVDAGKSFESSAHWLYILERAISVSACGENSDLSRRIIETAVNTPDVLESCYSILIAPVASGKAQDIYLPHVASVLFHFANQSYDVSKQVVEALLGPVLAGFAHGMVATRPSSSGGLSQLSTVVELLYKLCCDLPKYGTLNLITVIGWLENCADNPESKVSCSVAAPEYFQAIASALWHIASVGKTDLRDICSPGLLMKMYKWTTKLNPTSSLKTAVDHVICSICYAQPWLFLYLMVRMGFLKQQDWTVTEYSANASKGKEQSMETLLQSWWEEECVWERMELDPGLLPAITSNKLMTLGRAAESPMGARLLLQSDLLPTLNKAILQFWSYYTARLTNPLASTSDTPVSTELVLSILTFFAELCRMNTLKTWFGQEGSGFWLPILSLLSSLPQSLKAAYFSSHMYDIESGIIQFLSKCCWSHPANQKIIATCLREIVLSQKASPHKAVFLHSMSSFCRRLLIQLLLENEKVIVQIKNTSRHSLKSPSQCIQLKDRHPSMGVSGSDRLFYISTHASAFDLLKIIEPPGVQLEKLAAEVQEPNRFLETLRNEQGLIGAGLEMIDQMQMAIDSGKAAKEKRSVSSYGAVESPGTLTPQDKRPIKTATKNLKPEGSLDRKVNAGDRMKAPACILELEEFPDVKIPPSMSIATLMAAVRSQNQDAFLDTLVFCLRAENRPVPTVSVTSASLSEGQGVSSIDLAGVLKVPPLPSTVEVFSMMGGLGLLAKHLPIVYPETLRQIALGSKFSGTLGVLMNTDKESPITAFQDEWVKVDASDDFYDEMLDSMVASTPLAKRAPGIKQISVMPGIPPHSMAAFGLFLSLPRFSEVLLGERTGAQCMLRLVMGVSDDADGNDIFNSAVAKTLPTLPFHVLRSLLDALPMSSNEGQSLRRVMVEVNAVHFILACLAVFTHQFCDPSLTPSLTHELVIAATKAHSGYSDQNKTTSGTVKSTTSDDKSHVYWAKGTGFGTGSTAQSWDVEMAIQKKKTEEENVTCLLHLLSSYINPKASKKEVEREVKKDGVRTASEIQGALPMHAEVMQMMQKSSLFSAISGYLRNDSVLDMSRHVPLYKSVLEFLRALVTSPPLIPLLAPPEGSSKKDDQCVSTLLSKMRDVVDNYSKRLSGNMKGGKGKVKGGSKVLEELDDEGLAILIPDIQMTAILVEKAVEEEMKKRQPMDVDMTDDASLSLVQIPKTLEERYIDEMKKLQFAFFEMITEDDETAGIRFTVPYHYESNVRTNYSRSSAGRLKRLAQESVTLSSSLPIAYGSTIFVRSDNDRLDVMKVLITGPVGTPYANGCFEFDIFFPADYPQSPMLINLETNGRQRVRFNPNLYTDGKVCLSILNTWHGRPEEKWNPQTSSLLPVLVAIQSLILNAEPYFNEPGYEKSRGTEQGERNNREYNVGIQIATVEWAMLDQLRHASPCFKDAIHRHFWMKRGEIMAQLEGWLEEIVQTCKTDKRAGKSVTGCADPVTVYKNNFALLKKEFMNMKAPVGLEDLGDLYPTVGSGIAIEGTSSSSSPSSTSTSAKPSPPTPSTEQPDSPPAPESVQEGEEKMSVDV